MPLLRLICLLLVAACGALPAVARQESGRDRPQIGAVKIGLGGACPSDRWAPVRVSIVGGARPFSGFLIAEFPQDGTQDGRVVVRAAATPGLESTVEFAAALPQHFSWMKLRLEDESGREAARLEVDTEDIRSPVQLASLRRGANSVVCVGDVSAVKHLKGSVDQAASAWIPPKSSPEPEARREQRLGRIAAIEAAAADLPRSWVAYDACEALVIRPEDVAQVDQRALDAVRAWVIAGGRLVLVVDQFGDLWRRWAPGGVEELVKLDERRPIEAARLAPIVAASAALRERIAVHDQEPLRGGESGRAAPALGRTLRLSAGAAGAGWSLRWSVDEGAGLIAEGPAGFGWVTLLGVDPASIVAGEGGGAPAGCWAEALRIALQPYLRRAGEDSGWGLGGFGLPGPMDPVLPGVLDYIAAGEDGAGLGVVSLWPFVAMSVLMLALAIAIGPLDAIGLRALRARHRSWLTALVWIGLASAVGFIMPAIFRAGSSDRATFGRVEVVDLSVDAREGRVVSPPLRTGVSGYFAASPKEWRLEGCEPGTFVRGAAAVQRWGRSRTWLPALETVHRSEAWPGGSTGSQVPAGPIGQGQWTFRALLDDGPAMQSRWREVTASLARSGDRLRLRVSNLPQGAAPTRLRVGGRVYRLVGAGSGEYVAEDAGAATDVEPSEQQGTMHGAGHALRRVEMLPQALRRWTAMAHLVEGGEWGLLSVERRGAPEISAGAGAQNWGATVARILIPVRGDDP